MEPIINTKPGAAISAVVSLFLLWLVACGPTGTRQQRAQSDYIPEYRAIAVEVDSLRMWQTIQQLAGFGSRMIGYPGEKKAAELIYRTFQEIGLDEVVYEPFIGAVPIDEGGLLELHDTGETFPLYGLWPNLVRPSTLPPTNARLYYAGTGKLADFDGKDVEGQIVLMDFNTGTNWLNAAQLGARAVIFYEPDWTTRTEAEEKYLQVPLSTPRFWVDRESGLRLKARLQETGSLMVRARGRMNWRRVQARNVVGVVHGTHPRLKDEIIVVETYYDAMSVAPAINPGANQAASIVALLEMARFFKAHPPARTLYFVATSGHFMSFRGIDAFANRHLRQAPYFAQRLPDPLNVKLFIGLDLTSERTQICATYLSLIFAGNALAMQRFYTPFGRRFMEYAGRSTAALGYSSSMLQNAISPVAGMSAPTFFPAGDIGLDPEMVFWSGVPALSFATAFAAREYVETPLDRPGDVKMHNLVPQARLMTALIMDAANDPFLIPDFKMELQDKFATGHIRVVEYDPKKSYVPDTPVPDAVIRFRRYNKSAMGVRNEFFTVADSNGLATFTMLEMGRTYPVEAYGIDEQTGAIIYAPDRGINGDASYPIEWKVDWYEKEKPVVVFRSTAIDLFDLVDPRYLKRLNEIEVLNEANSEPLAYGYTFQHGIWTTGRSYEEDTAVIHMPPGERFKVTMRTGLLGRRLVLINADAEHPEGIGYSSNLRGIYHTAYRVANDMWHLDEYRIQQLRAAGIQSGRLETFHRRAEEMLHKAQQARAALRWDDFNKYARAAWGFESRAYPDATSTANDVMHGLLFYMALVIPFAYALERLVFGFANIYKQIGTAFAIFLLVYIVFRLLHPAFRISKTPEVVLLAFITLTLAGVVIWVITQKFSVQMRQMRQEQSGGAVHETDIQRASALATAFALGIGNMRRRRLRTALTALTLVLLTFTVVSFTSVRTTLRIQKVPHDGAPLYDGALIRNQDWAVLPWQTYFYVASAFEPTRPEDPQTLVVPRAWSVGTITNPQIYIKIDSDRPNRSGEDSFTYARALLGLTPEEPRISGVDQTLIAGNWFGPDERYACILPREMAALLGVRPEEAGQARIRIFGRDFLVKGVLDSETFDRLRDIDGEPITPVDYQGVDQELLTQLARMKDEEIVEMVSFDHTPAANTLILPLEYVTDVGGRIRSIAVKFDDADQARGAIEAFVERLGIPVVVSLNGKTATYSALAMSTVSGIGNLFIPILIAALIVLNTMVNAVHERFKEINIYSAVGLAPIHIATLFMAEAAIYAIIGGMSGYLVGQSLATLLTRFDLLGGLTLNYSSLSAVASTALIMSTVMLSAIYPARMAARMAVPDVKRAWHFPAPQGNRWRFDFPFTVPQREALGLCTFLYDFFRHYGEESIGRFHTDAVRLRRQSLNGRVGYHLDSRVWLAPFDLGVSEDFSIEAFPAGDFDAYNIEVTIIHRSGAIDAWERVNRRFISMLRKQFLIWRTIGEEVKMNYRQQGEVTLERAAVAERQGQD